MSKNWIAATGSAGGRCTSGCGCGSGCGSSGDLAFSQYNFSTHFSGTRSKFVTNGNILLDIHGIKPTITPLNWSDQDGLTIDQRLAILLTR
jgi:hypothetical protein